MLKSEYKSCDKINDLEKNSIANSTVTSSSSSPDSDKDLTRRMSSPVQHSRFIKLLDKTINFTSASFSSTPTPLLMPCQSTKSSNNISNSQRSQAAPSQKEELIDKLFSKFRHNSSSRKTTPIHGNSKNKRNSSISSHTIGSSGKEDSESMLSSSSEMNNDYKNKPIETIRKDIHAIFDHLNMSLEEITGNLEEEKICSTPSPAHQFKKLISSSKKPAAADKVAKKSVTGKQQPEETNKEFVDILNKIDTFCGNRSSKSSINSEEGYYSNHDSSISTQINEQTVNKSTCTNSTVIAASTTANPNKVFHQSPKFTPKENGKMRSVKKSINQQNHTISSNSMRQRTFSTPELLKELNMSDISSPSLMCQDSNLINDAEDHAEYHEEDCIRDYSSLNSTFTTCSSQTPEGVVIRKSQLKRETPLYQKNGNAHLAKMNLNSSMSILTRKCLSPTSSEENKQPQYTHSNTNLYDDGSYQPSSISMEQKCKILDKSRCTNKSVNVGVYSQNSPRQILKKNSSLSKTKFHENFNSYSFNLNLNRNNETCNNPAMNNCVNNANGSFSTGSSCSSNASSRRQSAESSFFTKFSTPNALERNGNDDDNDVYDAANGDCDDDYDSFAESSPDDENSLNVKDLITKFENRKLIFNKRNVSTNCISTKLMK